MAQHFMAVCVVCLLCVEQLPCQQHFNADLSFSLQGNHIEKVNNKKDVSSTYATNEIHNTNRNKDISNLSYATTYPANVAATTMHDGHQPNTFNCSESSSISDVISSDNRTFNSISNSSRVKRHANHHHHPATSKSKNLLESTVDAATITSMPKITQEYLKNLFNEYGAQDGTISLSSFQRMLRQLGLTQLLEQRIIDAGISVKESTETLKARKTPTTTNTTNNSECITETSLLYLLHDLPVNCSTHTLCNDHIDEQHVLSQQDMLHMCPVLLQQLASPIANQRTGCIQQTLITSIQQQQLAERASHLKTSKQNNIMVWTYAFFSVLACSVLGLVGVAIIPFMDSYYYKHIIQFLVALAVGTMTGDALLHLLPHSLANQSEENMIYKGLVCMSGILFFYITEHGLTMISEWRKQKAKRDNKNPKWQMAKVMLEPDSTRHVESAACNSTMCDGTEKVCKSKYSAYPYCYDDIAMDMLHDVWLHMPKNSNINANVLDGGGDCLNGATDDKDRFERRRNGKMIPAEHDISEMAAVQALLQNQHDQQQSSNQQHNCQQQNHSHNHYPQLHMHNMHHNQQNNHLKQQQQQQQQAITEFEEPLKQHIADGIAVNGNVNEHNCSGCNCTNCGAGSHDTIDEIRRNSCAGIIMPRAPSMQADADAVTVIVREHEASHRGHNRKHGHVHSPPESLSAVAWMIIMGDGLHNFTDGMAIGAAFAENIAGGCSTALAVFCHELPHELGDFAILMKAGMSIKSAVYYNLLTSILSFIGMIFGIVFGQSQEAAQWMFATAAGLFIYIALVDMIPEISAHKSIFEFALQIIGISSGVTLMLLIAIFENDLMNVFPSQ